MTGAGAANIRDARPPARFRHAPPPLPMQYAIGFVMSGILRPLIRTFEGFGRGEKLFNAMPSVHERAARNNPFRGYEPGPQDVFVMTYAKSGTNWMMQIALQLIHHARAEFEHIHDVVPWPDTTAMGGFMKRYAIPLSDAIDWENAPERKRVIKTHFNWDLLPYTPAARYIAVIRDPKDVFVSNYFFLRDGMYGAAMPSVDTWYKLYLSRRFPLGGSWAVNAAGYWAQRDRSNVRIMSFKAMKKDLRAAVLQVADFLEIRVTSETIDEVVRLSSFAHMKTIDHKFHMGQLVPWRAPGPMIRKGAQSGSAELLSPARQREMDEYFVTELRALGSDLPYEEFADLAT